MRRVEEMGDADRVVIRKRGLNARVRLTWHDDRLLVTCNVMILIVIVFPFQS